ncbi:MAG: helicase [Gemmatimonadales bacterium]|nr:helicase [Gemmatimonadales bacterium]
MDEIGQGARPALVGKQARAVMARADGLHGAARTLLADHDEARTAVRHALAPLTEDLARTELDRIPVARLREVTGGRLRLGPLEQAGYATVGQVLSTPVYQLRSVPGIGAQSAAQLHAAAQQICAAVRESVAVRIDIDDRNPRTTALVVALGRLVGAGPDLSRACTAAGRLDEQLPVLLAAARPTRGRLRMLLAGRQRRERARAAVAQLSELLAQETAEQTHLRLTQATTDLLRGGSAAEAWIEFELSAPEFYTILAETATAPPDPDASRGFVPNEIADRVNAQHLDETHRRVSLRGYQAFGARFALAQRKVILGDEMGLGKSVEAIAVLAHLRAEGHLHFLIACPASVLVNWIRELETRSALRAHRVHGTGRSDALAVWIAEGGVAVTTIDSLHTLQVPDEITVGALVVDEAHYVKNPQTRRSQAVAGWCERTERVLFLTGTPMENRLEEFRNLVRYLQPGLADQIRPGAGAGRPEGFRKAVAPVYLRRNQKDVLTELPGLVHMDEWTEFSTADWEHYREAVGRGNFMAMRRAAYADPEKSAKLTRLEEIIGDAADNNLKVVVFSYFHDVLNAVHEQLGPGVFGPITGGVTPTRRQEMVDRFSSSSGHAVLLSQIQAGGIGLNLQAASVVILCEPQVKPALEAQAIARAHRMGQVRPVRAHRLLADDTLDQRMLQILEQKSRVFDAYLRRSDLAESTPQAVDIAETTLARQIVEEEQLRFAQSPTPQ